MKYHIYRCWDFKESWLEKKTRIGISFGNESKLLLNGIKTSMKNLREKLQKERKWEREHLVMGDISRSEPVSNWMKKPLFFYPLLSLSSSFFNKVWWIFRGKNSKEKLGGGIKQWKKERQNEREEARRPKRNAKRAQNQKGKWEERRRTKTN